LSCFAFFEQRLRIENNPASDDAFHSWLENARRYEMKHVTAITDADRMPGIMSALVAGYAGIPLRQDVDDFSFSFVAPLNSDDCEVPFHLEMFIEGFGDHALVDSADNLLFDLAVFEDEKGRNTPDIETRSGCAIGVDIELSDFHSAFVFFGDRVDRWCDRAARSTP
jgi:hypothetical protein